jgi:serine/threonine protein kinase
MSTAYSSDEELVRRLPLPLAQLYRRAHNAKTALDRHQAAYFLWEAALKLLSCAAIAEYAERPEHDPKLAERLQNLARPSLGHWWEFTRLLVPVLADGGDAGFQQVRELVLGRARNDLPRVAGLDAVLRETLDGASGPRPAVRLTELFDRLVQYRNRELGHGAHGQRSGDFYERVGGALLAGVPELLGRLDVLAGRRLVHIGEVRRQPSGNWLVERYELVGEAARRLEPLEWPEGEAAGLPRPERVHLVSAADRPALRSLHPLVVHDAEADEVLFLNARRGKQRGEYLCYTSGRVAERQELAGEQRALLARVLSMPVDDGTVRQWQARSQAEDPAGEEPAGGPSRQVGEFELLSELGRGGMGVVYRALQPSLGRQVALKCLLRSGDPNAEARFGKEIRALGRVEHPHLVKVFTSGVDGERYYYAMELLEGAPLSAVCDRLPSAGASAAELDLKTWHEAVSTVCAESRRAEKPLGATPASRERERPEEAPVAHAPGSPAKMTGRGYVRHVAELVRQVAEAAHALHQAGVVHRDIKPGNIIVSADGGQAVLMDLGLAQIADETDGRLTRTRQFVGTLRYASPEQVMASAGLDRRSDVYSLGVTLWELLTLRPMYGATEQVPTFEVEKRIMVGDVEPARKHNPRVPTDLDAVLMKCLEKDPGKRYATARELADDLGRFLAGEPVKARPIGPVRRGLRWIRRRPVTTAVILGGLLLLAAAVGGLWFWDARYRVKVEYYANTVNRGGVQEGVGRLSEEEARHRGASYRLTRRGGRVEMVEVVNGHGQLTAQAPVAALIAAKVEPTSAAGRECRYEYHRDERGRLAEEIAYDRAGEVVWSIQYDTLTTAHYKDRRGIIRARAGTGAAYVQLAWSPQGFLQEVRYLDRDGKPQANADGSFGEHYLLDERGLVAEVTNLDENGDPAAHRDGYVHVANGYDADGNLVEKRYLGPKGELVPTKKGYARLTQEYDPHGNPVKESYFGPDGKSVLQQAGYASRTRRYDDRGDPVKESYFGLDGPVLSQLGFHKVVMTWDEYGNIREMKFLGTDDKLCRLKAGFAKLTLEWDEHGNWTRMAYFDVDEQPAPHPQGFYGRRREYDRGNCTKEELLDRDRKLMRSLSGYAISKMVYDEGGNVIRQEFFDEREERVKSLLGYQRWNGTYHACGQLGEEHWYDEHGVAVAPAFSGCAGVRYDYDQRGNRTRLIYLDANDNPVQTKDGYASWKAEHDNRGNVTRKLHFDAQGKPALLADGTAGWAARYDGRSNEVEHTFLGPDGEPMVPPGKKYATVRGQFDARGDPIDVEYLDANGHRLRTRVVVTKVDPGSPADKTGLRVGDILVSYGGQEIGDPRRFKRIRDAERDHDPVQELCILRGGETLKFPLPHRTPGYNLRTEVILDDPGQPSGPKE